MKRRESGLRIWSESSGRKSSLKGRRDFIRNNLISLKFKPIPSLTNDKKSIKLL
jgi:hypothetical protein